MENSIEIFKNEEFGQVRMLLRDKKPWFVANDIAKALGYTNPSKATNDHCKKSIMEWGNDSLGRQQQFKIIPEGDVYRLIAKSKLPQAEKFESWVFDEVLPTIRKHGAYMTDNTIEKALTDPDFLIKLATQLKEEKQARIKAEEEKKILEFKIEEDKPLVEFSKQVSESVNAIDVGDFAKLVKNEHIDIGRNRLFDWLRSNKYLMKNNVPYQNRITQGLFEVNEYTYMTPYGVQIGVKTKITGKGQIYLVEKLREQFCS